MYTGNAYLDDAQNRYKLLRGLTLVRWNVDLVAFFVVIDQL
jgi:hypothetical protein